MIKDKRYIIPDKDSTINIEIDWDLFNNMSYNDPIPFKCPCCELLKYKAKKHIIQAIERNSEYMVCSKTCYNEFKPKNTLNRMPARQELIDLINKDFSVAEIGNVYDRCEATVCKWLKTYGLKTNFTNDLSNPKTKNKIKERMIAFTKENPTHGRQKGSNNISIPCEKLKRELRERNIEFKEEVMPLHHLGRLYRADILFEKYGVIVEVNGSHHFVNKQSKFGLTPYFQERHDLLVQNGWRVFEIPTKLVMSEDFLDKLLPEIYNTKSNPNFEYKSLNNPNFCKCGKSIQRKRKRCWECRKAAYLCPLTKECLYWYIWNYSQVKLIEMFDICKELLIKWIKSMNYKEIPHGDYYVKYKHGKIIDYQI